MLRPAYLTCQSYSRPQHRINSEGMAEHGRAYSVRYRSGRRAERFGQRRLQARERRFPVLTNEIPFLHECLGNLGFCFAF